MKFIYSVDTFGRYYLEYKGNSKKEFEKKIDMLYKNFSDEDTHRYLIITTKEKKECHIENE